MKVQLLKWVLCFWPFVLATAQDQNTTLRHLNESPRFYLDTNGVTIKCENCKPGDTGTVNGNIYEAVDRALLEQRRDEGADLTKLCTSLAKDMDSLFYKMEEFNQDIGSWDVSNVTSMKKMFAGSGFNQNISFWNVSNVIDMSYMFLGNVNIDALHETPFNQPINSWDVSNVTNMCGMFEGANSFNQDISSWDVGNVTNMSRMFAGYNNWVPIYNKFNQDISMWDVSNVINMAGMFSQSVFNREIGKWNVSKVQDMHNMFQAASSFNQDIGEWDVSSVKSMRQMFAPSYGLGANDKSIFNRDIGSWNVSNVTDMSYMFASTKDFNQDISNWDVSKVRDMSYMFSSAENFNQDIGGWDVSKVENMSYMFDRASSFNQDIGEWDVSKVWGMSHMFNQASSFNQDLSNWCVLEILFQQEHFAFKCPLLDEYYPTWGTCKPLPHEYNFYKADNGITIKCDNCQQGDTGTINGITYTAVNRYYLEKMMDRGDDISTICTSPITELEIMFADSDSIEDITSWDVSNVTNMGRMFLNAKNFNQDISIWDVSNVTNMYRMFEGAVNFNQDIGSWDVSNVTSMSDMFKSAKSFNQDIGSWDVSNVRGMRSMFRDASSFNQNLSAWCVELIPMLPQDFGVHSLLAGPNYPKWGTCPAVGFEEAIPSELQIYPNPIITTALIQAPNQSIIQKIELVDLTGKVVRFIDQVNSTQVTLERTGLTSGVYIMKIHADKVYVSKVVIQ